MKKKIILYISILFILLWTLAPIYWGLRTSLISEIDLKSKEINYFPSAIDLGNYKNLFGFEQANNMWSAFSPALLNSLIISSLTTILVVLAATLAGYAFARLKFKGQHILFGMVLVTMALPAYAVIIPLYKIMIEFKLVDTASGITVIYISAFAPLAVWLMRNYFITIPKALDEAAMIDGASRFRALLTILPLSLPGIITAAILTFLNAWGQFLIPLIFSPSKTKPLTVLITEFSGRYEIEYGLITAAGMITIIPPLLIVLFLNKYIMNGLMEASVKQ